MNEITAIIIGGVIGWIIGGLLGILLIRKFDK